MKAYLENFDGELLPESSYSTQFEILNELKDLSNHSDSNCLHRNRYLFEFDDLSLEKQISLLVPLLELNIINRIVFSGSKSYHTIIETDYDAKNTEEYKTIWKYFEEKYFKGSDKACANPARLTRCPNALRSDKMTTQDLMYESDNIVKLDKKKLDEILNRLNFDKTKKLVDTAISIKKQFKQTNNTNDGLCLNYDVITHYLNTSYPNTTGNGDSSISLFKAVRCCIKYSDETTLQKVLDKARLEHWSEKELDRLIENVKQKYI